MKYFIPIASFTSALFLGSVVSGLAFGSFGLGSLSRLLIFAALIGFAIMLFCRAKGCGTGSFKCEADFKHDGFGFDDSEE